MSDFIAYLEDHPSLFVALGGVATVLGAVAGCVLQYFAMKGQRDRLELELAESKKREGAFEEKVSNLQMDLEDGKNDKDRLVAALDQSKVDHQTKRLFQNPLKRQLDDTRSHEPRSPSPGV